MTTFNLQFLKIKRELCLCEKYIEGIQVKPYPLLINRRICDNSLIIET